MKDEGVGDADIEHVQQECFVALERLSAVSIVGEQLICDIDSTHVTIILHDAVWLRDNFLLRVQLFSCI